MNFKLLFPSNYLGAHDLLGKDATLTIRHIVVEELKTERGTEKKPVLYFVETQRKAAANKTEEKRMILNKTNAVTIASMYGPEVNDWVGKRITLFSVAVDAFGKTVEALRVRPNPPKSEPVPSQPQPEPEK